MYYNHSVYFLFPHGVMHVSILGNLFSSLILGLWFWDNIFHVCSLIKTNKETKKGEFGTRLRNCRDKQIKLGYSIALFSQRVSNVLSYGSPLVIEHQTPYLYLCDRNTSFLLLL